MTTATRRQSSKKAVSKKVRKKKVSRARDRPSSEVGPLLVRPNTPGVLDLSTGELLPPSRFPKLDSDINQYLDRLVEATTFSEVLRVLLRW